MIRDTLHITHSFSEHFVYNTIHNRDTLHITHNIIRTLLYKALNCGHFAHKALNNKDALFHPGIWFDGGSDEVLA